MKKSKSIKIKIIITILLGTAAVFLYLYALNVSQSRSVMLQIREEMEEDSVSLLENYEIANLQHDYLRSSFEKLHEQDIMLIYSVMPDDLEDGEIDEFLEDINEYFQFTDIMLINQKGEITASAEGEYQGLDPEIIETLKETFTTGELVRYEVLTEESSADVETYQNAEAIQTTDDRASSNLYAKVVDDDLAIVLSIDDRLATTLRAASDGWTMLLKNETVGEQGYSFVWSEDDKRILYYPEEDFKYADVKTLGMDMSKIKSGKYGWNTVNGEKMYVYPVLDEEKGVWIACAVPRDELVNSRKYVTILQWIVFILLLAALVYYVILLLCQNKIKVLTDFTGSGKIRAHQSRQHKLLISTILISMMLMIIAFYLQTLFLMSSWAESSSRQTQRIETTVSSNEVLAQLYTILYDAEKKSQILVFCQYLSANKDLQKPATLDQYSYILEAFDLQILGKDGVSNVSNTYMAYPSLLDESEAEDSLDYAALVASQDKNRAICDWMKDGRRSIQPLTDEEGTVTSYLYVHYYSLEAESVLEGFSLQGTLRMVRPGKSGFVFSVDSKTYQFFYYPEEELIGRDAVDYGLSKKQIKDNFCDYITLNTKSYYATTDLIGSDVIFYVVAKNDLLHQRVFFTAYATAAAFILFMFIGILVYTSRQQIEMTNPDAERSHEEDETLSPEEKMLRLLLYYSAAAAAVFSIYSVIRTEGGTGTVLGYVLDGKWEPGINVFALTASLIIMCRGGVILFILSKLVGAVGDILPVRAGTILKMMGSLLTYVAIAFLLYQCMLCFGLNPTALMASAGIASVVIGIGAKSLVGDILAGIFLLMEGNVQVGDVVQIGNFRGYVMELGIRMTKLFDMDKDDVKIIPNDEVRNVVHMTMRKAIVYSEFQIRYEERLESVEKILKEELKNVKNKSPLILEGPVYIGVSALGDNGVCLKTETKCHESCRLKVEREVNHIVYTIFQKHDIGVPYPQVTVHPGDDSMVEREFPEDEKRPEF